MGEDELIRQIAAILDGLGPFAKGAPRESKWLTTEQLANKLWQTDAHLHLKDLDESLTQYEAEYRERLEKGLKPDALIRRAVYPDRSPQTSFESSKQTSGSGLLPVAVIP